MRTLALAFLLAACGNLAAADPRVVEVPRDKPGEWSAFSVATGRQLILDAKSPAKWILVDDGADLTADALGGKTAVFSAPAPGRYRVVVVIAGEPVRVQVTVGADPGPPDPPRPIPPDPPKPDTLTVDLRDAFAADKGKAADMHALSALYTLMADECGKTDYSTPADLNAAYLAARDRMLKGALPGVRKRAGAEIVSAIADPAATLDADVRLKLKALYLKLAKAVEDAAK